MAAAAVRLPTGPPPGGADELAEALAVLESPAAAVPWDALAASRLIGERELQALRRYDSKPEALQASLLDEVSVEGRSGRRGVGGACAWCLSIARVEPAVAIATRQRSLPARATPAPPPPLSPALTPRKTPSPPQKNPQFGPAIVGAIVSVLRNVSSEEAVHRALAMLVAMLARSPARAALLARPLPADSLSAAADAPDLLSGDGGAEAAAASGPSSTTQEVDACAVLLRLLQRPDWFTQEKAARVLAQALAARPPGSGVGGSGSSNGTSEIRAAADDKNPTTSVDPITAAFLEWCCGQLRRPAHPARAVPSAVRALSLVLREKSARAAFTRSGGPALLSAPLRAATGSPAESQLLYELCLCLWQLSFCRPAAEAAVTAGAVPSLVAALRSAHKEKVVRVALFALRNLLEADPEIEGVAHQAAEAGLAKAVATRRLQQWGDEDVAPALEQVSQRLAKGVELLSSWEAYRRELTSGRLD